jgi:hypothetical protein
MKIIDDPGFHRLMKTGRPHYRLPSSRTTTRDVHVVFKRVKERIATILQVSFFKNHDIRVLTTIYGKKYDGRLSFATDAWTSPNQRAYVAITVHLEYKGEPISLLLDIVEVAKSHTGVNLAAAFAMILEDYGISDKVLIYLVF